MVAITGIDTDLGNHCSRIAFNWAKKTFPNRHNLPGNPLPMESGSFCNILNFGNARIGMTSDGIGTKVEIAERTGIYDTLGFDLLAMVADDLAANGIVPTNVSNILDVDRLDPTIVESLMRGLHDAANLCQVTVTGGEIAELGSRIGGYGEGMHFNWCATAIGVLPEGRSPVIGNEVAVGDAVIALQSRGFRSNGFSMARNILGERFGEDWHNVEYRDKRSWGEVLLTPCLIFARFIAKALDSGFPLHGIAHVTGGGVPDNLGRFLKINRLGAILDGLFPPHDFMKELQEIGRLDDRKAYSIWNMGNGMLVILPMEKADEFLRLAGEETISARLAGRICPEPIISVHSKGLSGDLIEYGNTGK